MCFVTKIHICSAVPSGEDGGLLIKQQQQQNNNQQQQQTSPQTTTKQNNKKRGITVMLWHTGAVWIFSSLQTNKIPLKHGSINNNRKRQLKA